MLFKGGGKLHKGDIGRIVSSVGGEYNGFTSKDFTAYFEVLPADQIEKGLLIESERMMNAAFDPREVESERTVVVSEREGMRTIPSSWPPKNYSFQPSDSTRTDGLREG